MRGWARGGVIPGVPVRLKFVEPQPFEFGKFSVVVGGVVAFSGLEDMHDFGGEGILAVLTPVALEVLVVVLPETETEQVPVDGAPGMK